ncbi:YlcI/YnfO family protein [Comamonas piscis]|uniref:YlcI/YnfO family protein n=1 Tax=Comamonas piscis TaxID=1562974 RepID=UPI001EE39567|nr:YlcI/YnfO family protein [Comamonas piscis]WSO32849.1 YlcI/YnfO family protein [Comamonas piscis]
MTTATIPSICVEPALLDEVEHALEPNESLASFVETAVRHEIQQRQAQAGWLQRGSAATRHNSAAAGIPAEVVIARLEAKLDAARQRK